MMNFHSMVRPSSHKHAPLANWHLCPYPDRVHFGYYQSRTHDVFVVMCNLHRQHCATNPIHHRMVRLADTHVVDWHCNCRRHRWHDVYCRTVVFVMPISVHSSAATTPSNTMAMQSNNDASALRCRSSANSYRFQVDCNTVKLMRTHIAMVYWNDSPATSMMYHDYYRCHCIGLQCFDVHPIWIVFDLAYVMCPCNNHTDMVRKVFADDNCRSIVLDLVWSHLSHTTAQNKENVDLVLFWYLCWGNDLPGSACKILCSHVVASPTHSYGWNQLPDSIEIRGSLLGKIRCSYSYWRCFPVELEENDWK